MRRRWRKKAWNEYQHWKTTNKAIADQIDRLLADIVQNPFTGLGKPEPLKWDLAGYWSRRITQEHRLVYKVEGEMIVIYRCKGHYE